MNRARLSRVQGLWRRDGIKPSVVTIYAQWLRRLGMDCARQGTDPDLVLTRAGVRRFADRYARRRHASRAGTRRAAEGALHAWSRASALLRYPVPPWSVPKLSAELPPLLAAFAEQQRAQRGLRAVSITKRSDHAARFLTFLRQRHRRLRHLRLCDVDAFVILQRRRYSTVVVADMCSSLRAFSRFLHATGRLAVDLAPAIQAPCFRRGARPPRALPWASVVQLIRAVDRRSRVGRRDYALLLLMATYGMGASEVTPIDLDDIDWRARTLRLTRPKTGVPIVLPVLPAIARALTAYLRHARPRSAQTRRLFVRMTGDHRPLGSSSAVRHIVVKHARVAGLPLKGLGSHTLRHSHATRQVNAGVPVAVISDVLGQRSPAVLSTYARVAIDRLREIALAVPA